MSMYLGIDDMLPVHPKIRLSHEAFRLHITAACWSHVNGTRGRIPAGDVHYIAETAQISEQPVLADPVIAELVASGCWTAIEDSGYQITANPNGDGEFWDIMRAAEEAP